jgi:hypothetical protein
VTRIWRLRTPEAAAALPAKLTSPEAAGSRVMGTGRRPARPPGDALESAECPRAAAILFPPQGRHWSCLPRAITLARGQAIPQRLRNVNRPRSRALRGLGPQGEATPASWWPKRPFPGGVERIAKARGVA